QEGSAADAPGARGAAHPARRAQAASSARRPRQVTVPAPLVTVVVPVYNVEDYLTACLESIQFQTLEDLEVVMVDDGSTDGSRAVAESCAARGPLFTLVTHEEGGHTRR